MKINVPFFKKHLLFISILCFITAFVLSRIPYFLIPIVGWGPDSTYYYYLAFQFLQHRLPAFTITGMGYPLFLFLSNFIVTKSYQILLLQNLITLFVYIFFIYSIYKYYRYMTAAVTLASIIIIFNAAQLKYDTELMTESIYVNSLILLITLAISCLNNPSKSMNWILLSLVFTLPMLIRLNGIVYIGLLLLLIFYIIYNRLNKKILLKLLIPFLSICIIWSSYNYKTQKIFFIGYPTMLLKSFSSLSIFHKYKPTKKQFEERNKMLAESPQSKYFNIPDSIGGKVIVNYPFETSPRKNFFNFYKNITDDNTNWYSVSKRRYKMIYIGKFSQSYDSAYGFQDTNFAKFVFRDYLSPPLSNINKFNNIRQNKIFKIYDYGYFKLYQPFFRNYFWLFLNLLIFLITIFLFIKSKLKEKDYFIILFIIFINILNSIPYFGFVSPLYRYTYTTEFTYYIVPTFFLFMVIKLYRLKFKKFSHN